MMRRGQAFETMMLVISVIVALAILNVLMGVISSVQVNVQGNAQDTMHDTLKELAKNGNGYSVPNKVILKKGTRLDSRSLLKTDMPEIDASMVRFCVTRTEIAEVVLPPSAASSCSTSAASGSLDLGPVAQDTAMYYVICGDVNFGARGAFHVSIASSPTSASKNCVIPTQN